MSGRQLEPACWDTHRSDVRHEPSHDDGGDGGDEGDEGDGGELQLLVSWTRGQNRPHLQVGLSPTLIPVNTLHVPSLQLPCS